MNLCRSCKKDFGSIAAFDTHRIGNHEYTSTEGLRMEPPKEDGRRCMLLWELKEATNKDETPMFSQNKHGRWSLTQGLESARSINDRTIAD